MLSIRRGSEIGLYCAARPIFWESITTGQPISVPIDSLHVSEDGTAGRPQYPQLNDLMVMAGAA
jgi:hypothetical protein